MLITAFLLLQRHEALVDPHIEQRLSLTFQQTPSISDGEAWRTTILLRS